MKHSSVHVCVIQHRNWPLRSTILNAHGINCSADGFYARTHINEPYLWYYLVRGMSFKVGGGRCGNVCFYRACDSGWATVLRFSKIQKIDKRFFVSLPGASTSIKLYHNRFFLVLEKILPSETSANNSYLQVGRPCTWETCCKWHYCCQACSTDGTGRVCYRCRSCGTWY